MKFFPEGKSRTLSGFSLAAAAVCGLMAIRAAVELLTLLDIFSTQAFYLDLARATLPAEMPPLARLIAGNMRLFFVFFVVFWTSGFILALGVCGRREWARSGAAAMLYLLSAAGLLLLLFPWLAIPRPLFYGDVPLSPEFNAAVGTAALAARLGALVAGSLSLWWALALDRGGLRKEFSRAGTKTVPDTAGKSQAG